MLQYVMDQQTVHLTKQTRIYRDLSEDDTRVHVAIYFVPPNPRPMAQFDVAMLSELCRVTNVIICIAKADTLLPHELQAQQEMVVL
jgi:septin family protein